MTKYWTRPKLHNVTWVLLGITVILLIAVIAAAAAGAPSTATGGLGAAFGLMACITFFWWIYVLMKPIDFDDVFNRDTAHMAMTTLKFMA